MTIQELIDELEKFKSIAKNEEIKVEIQDHNTYYGNVDILGISTDQFGNVLIDTEDFNQ